MKARILAGIALLILSSTSFAASYKCVGLDGEGNKINVLYDEDTSTVNVNGHILKIEAGTNGKNGVATEDFKNDDDVEVYYSLVVEGKGKIVLRQMTTKDDEELAVVPLACE